jgi:ABC-type dipeptide/oligopeptide/nickel transport system permease subunit
MNREHAQVLSRTSSDASDSVMGPSVVSGVRERTFFQRRARIFFAGSANKVGLVIVIVFVLCAAFPVRWLPHDPTFVAPGQRHIPPIWQSGGDAAYPLGTDHLGRDMLSRLIFSARYTLAVMVCAVFIATGAGVVAGLLSGFYGGILDSIINRLVDIQLAFPLVLLAIAVLAVIGPGFANLVLILGLFDWAGYTRVVRGSTLSVRTSDFIEAAKAIGASNSRILLRHVLPNVISPILVLTTFALARVLLAESALSFLGLGIPPPQATWGGMIGDARNYLYEAWWSSAIPGIAISLTVLAINFVGDGLRDALDPQMETNDIG